MPDLSNLLHEGIAEEYVDVIVPEGYWNGVIKGGKIKDTNADGDPYTDKNGEEFALGFIYVQCDTPAEGVDSAEADNYIDNDGPRESMATHRSFIRGKRDIRKLTGFLQEAGVPTAGMSLVDIIKGLKSVQPPVKVLIEHEDYKGDVQANVTELLPA